MQAVGSLACALRLGHSVPCYPLTEPLCVLPLSPCFPFQVFLWSLSHTIAGVFLVKPSTPLYTPYILKFPKIQTLQTIAGFFQT